MTSRSEIMRAVRSVDTSPEIVVRKLIHARGYRFRLHRRDLPGCPDLVFPARRKVVFVHGCFWHGHSCKRGARVPKSNKKYWEAKIARNVERDASHLKSLKRSGWKPFVIWECELKKIAKLERRIVRFLS